MPEQKPLIRLGTTDSVKFNDFTIRFNTAVIYGGTGVTATAILDLRTNYFNDVKVYGNLLVDLRSTPIFYNEESNATYFDKNYTATSNPGFFSLYNKDYRIGSSNPAVNYATGVNDYPDRDAFGYSRIASSLDAGAVARTVENETVLDAKLTLDPYDENDFFSI